MTEPRHRVVIRRHYHRQPAAPRASTVFVGVLLAALAACAAYRAGYSAGSDAGWWSCMAEHGEVA